MKKNYAPVSTRIIGHIIITFKITKDFLSLFVLFHNPLIISKIPRELTQQVLMRYVPGADPGFQVRGGGALKKIAPSAKILGYFV